MLSRLLQQIYWLGINLRIALRRALTSSIELKDCKESFLITRPGAEHTIISSTTPGWYSLDLNFKHNGPTNSFKLSVYKVMMGAGGKLSTELFAEHEIDGIQHEAIKTIPEMYVHRGIKVTLTQIFGESCHIGYFWYVR